MQLTITPARFDALAAVYSKLRVAVAGDFCLDRYLEIDPARSETSIETGLPVHNIVRVRPQPGAAGTILNNLVALEPAAIHTIGFAGEDGEGYELLRCLRESPRVDVGRFVQTPLRHTFTYCKPLVVAPGKPPVELSRLDTKNWSPTPPEVQAQLARHVEELAPQMDAVIVLDQVDLPETGVVTARFRETLAAISVRYPNLLILADSRRHLRDFPPLGFKMNRHELALFQDSAESLTLDRVRDAAVTLARRNGRPVFVTASEDGMLGALPNGEVAHVPVFPIRGQIDIVGAGDAVSANLTLALAAGASLTEALEIASAAASVVIHKLGTTGTASLREIRQVLFAT